MSSRSARRKVSPASAIKSLKLHSHISVNVVAFILYVAGARGGGRGREHGDDEKKRRRRVGKAREHRSTRRFVFIVTKSDSARTTAMNCSSTLYYRASRIHVHLPTMRRLLFFSSLPIFCSFTFFFLTISLTQFVRSSEEDDIFLMRI